MSTLYSWLVETSLTLSILIIAVLILRRPVARLFGPSFAYALWALPLLRLALPKLYILPAAPVQAPETFTAFLPAPIVPMNAAPQALNIAQPASVNWTQMAIYIWLAGIAIYLAAQIFRQVRFQNYIRKTSHAPTHSLRARFEKLCASHKLNRAPKLSTAEASGPLVMGLLRPHIVVPSDFETAYNHAEQDLALTHELLHIKRKDLWSSCAGLLLSASQWFNPLFYIAHKYFRTDQEAACDASVMALQKRNGHNTYTYANALVKAAKLTKTNTPIYTPLALSFGPNFKERLMYLEQPPKTRTRKLLGKATASALILSGLAISANYGYAKPKTNAQNGKLVFDFQIIEYAPGNKNFTHVSGQGGLSADEQDAAFADARKQCRITDVDTQWVAYRLRMQAEVPTDVLQVTFSCVNYADYGGSSDGNPHIPTLIRKTHLERLAAHILNSKQADSDPAKNALWVINDRLIAIDGQIDGKFALGKPTNENAVSFSTSVRNYTGDFPPENLPTSSHKRPAGTLMLDQNAAPGSVNLSDCGVETKVAINVWEHDEDTSMFTQQAICMPSENFATTEAQIAFLQTDMRKHLGRGLPNLTDDHIALINDDLNKKVLALSEQ